MQMHNEYCFSYKKKKKNAKKNYKYFYQNWKKKKEKSFTRKVEKTVPLKSLFDLSRYLDRSPRYKDRKFAQLSNR